MHPGSFLSELQRERFCMCTVEQSVDPTLTKYQTYINDGTNWYYMALVGAPKWTVQNPLYSFPDEKHLRRI